MEPVEEEYSPLVTQLNSKSWSTCTMFKRMHLIKCHFEIGIGSTSDNAHEANENERSLHRSKEMLNLCFSLFIIGMLYLNSLYSLFDPHFNRMQLITKKYNDLLKRREVFNK